MRLNNYMSRNDLFIDWILEAVPRDCSILDVGANDGSFCPEVSRIVQHARQLEGVDPDRDKLERNPFISERHYSTLEDAKLVPNSFDAIYSLYVFEHVLDEARFICAASRALKPGGSLFFITPNGHHYFSVLASIFARLRIQRSMLGVLRSRSLVDSYHYPAVYRLNTPRSIELVGRKYGFNKFEYRYSELLEDVSPYFPGPTKIFPWLWERFAEATGRDALLVNFMGRMIKDAQ